MINIVIEVIIRTALIFFFTFLIMRVRGRRQLVQFTIFDIIIIIALGSAVGDVMIYPDNVTSIVRSMTAITTIVFLIYFIEKLLFKAPLSISKLIEGDVIILVKNGKLVKENLKKSKITEGELRSRLREKNIEHFSEARIARLEPDGQISVRRKKRNHRVK